MSFTDQEQVLLEGLFRRGAVLLGDAVHARYGLNSPIYFDLREPLHAHPDLLWQVGRQFALKICQLTRERPVPQCVVGIPDTATPLAVATALYAAENQVQPEIACALLRKEGKKYPGLPVTNWIGPKDSRYEYNLIDDVVASGLTKRSAAAKMRQEGIPLRRIIVLFDREQGDGLRQDGFDLHAIFTASDAVTFYAERGLVSRADYSKIREFFSSRRFDVSATPK